MKFFIKNYNIDIMHNDDGKKGVFYFEVDGKQEAKMTYKYDGPKKNNH